MTGTWVNDAADGKVTESWVGPGNGLMVAANLSTFAGGKRAFEFLRIADTPDGFSYYASPGGRPAVEFRMKETAGRRVEGTINGKDRNEEWRFKRAP